MNLLLHTRGPRLIAPLIPSATWRLPTDRRAFCLTIDDGPTEHGTPELLDLLDRHAVSAVFFVVGRDAERRPDLVREIVARGHTVGNHSWSHPNFWRLPARRQVEELARTDRLLNDLIGEPPAWVRPPYGCGTPTLLRWASRRGQRVLLWDTMPPDYDRRHPPEALKHHLAMIRCGSVICLHDNADTVGHTGALLDEWLPQALDIGWEAVTPENSLYGTHRAGRPRADFRLRLR